MAADLLYPLYDILVNTIFGSIALAILAVGAILALMLALCKCSWVFVLQWEVFYFLVMTTFWLHGVGLVIVFILSAMFLITQIVRYFAPDR